MIDGARPITTSSGLGGALGVDEPEESEGADEVPGSNASTYLQVRDNLVQLWQTGRPRSQRTFLALHVLQPCRLLEWKFRDGMFACEVLAGL